MSEEATTITLTAPVSPEIHEEVKATAKAAGIPMQKLTALLIERGLADIANGSLVIKPPQIQPA